MGLYERPATQLWKKSVIICYSYDENVTDLNYARQIVSGAHRNEPTVAPVLTFWHSPGPNVFVRSSPSTKSQEEFGKYVTQWVLLPLIW